MLNDELSKNTKKGVIELRESLVFKRLSMRLQQQDVAKQLKMNKSSYCQLEKGNRKVTYDEAVRIKVFYNLDWEELDGILQVKNDNR
jgi:transcriptional regulator with XRE-family HTH domain